MSTGEIAARLAPGTERAFHTAILVASADLYGNNRSMPTGELLTVQLTITLDVLWITLKEITPDADEMLFRRLLVRLAKGIVRGEHLAREGSLQ